jgi:hypothetical protein
MFERAGNRRRPEPGCRARLSAGRCKTRVKSVELVLRSTLPHDVRRTGSGLRTVSCCSTSVEPGPRVGTSPAAWCPPNLFRASESLRPRAGWVRPRDEAARHSPPGVDARRRPSLDRNARVWGGTIVAARPGSGSVWCPDQEPANREITPSVAPWTPVKDPRSGSSRRASRCAGRPSRRG